MTGLWRFVADEDATKRRSLQSLRPGEPYPSHDRFIEKQRDPRNSEACFAPRKEESLPEPLSQEAEERLKLAIAAADIGTWDLDVFSNTLRSCRRCTAILGSPLDTRNWYQEFLECVHPEDRGMVDANVRSALDPRGTGQYDHEYHVICAGELRWVAAGGKAFLRRSMAVVGGPFH